MIGSVLSRARREIGALQIFVALAGLLVVGLTWRSEREFVAAIDHGDRLLQDFVFVYYPTVRDSLRSGAPAGGFFYPAGFAALIAPLALVPFGAAKVVWIAVLFGCLAVVAGPLVRAAAEGDPAVTLLATFAAVTSVPVLHDLRWGQVSLPIIAAVGAAFVLYTRDTRDARGRAWSSAALLGAAAGIKGYPIVFILYFVAKGDVRFALRAGLACVVSLALLPAIVLGPVHAVFVQRVSTSSVLGAAAGVAYDFNSQWAPAVYARYGGGWDVAPGRSAAEIASLAALACVAALVVLVARSRAPRVAARRELFAFVLVAASVPFWLRTSWSHYFVHLPIAQALAARVLLDRRRPSDVAAVLLLVVPSVFLASMFALRRTEGWWYYANAGSVFFANALVLLALAGFVVTEHVRHVRDSAACTAAVHGRRNAGRMTTSCMLRAMSARPFTFGLVMLTSLAGVAACGGENASNAAATTPTSTPTTTTTGPKAPDHPESDKVTWKKGAKTCHTGAKAAGDLTAVVTSMASACMDATMKQVGAPTTGQGDASQASTMVKQIPLAAKANHCYRAIGIADPTVTDFDIAILDSGGKSAGEDATDSNDSVVLEDGVVCFTADDNASVNAAVANGTGKWAVEIWSN